MESPESIAWGSIAHEPYQNGRRRRRKTRGELLDIYPAINLREPMVRHGVSVVGAATFLSVLIFGTASYRGGQYMDSTQFCGQTCHTVMTPRAYSLSKFAPLAHHCVECHIGPGASRFVRSKLSGVRQVFAFTPIRAPSMRRSNTCAPRKLASNVTQSPRLAGEVAAGLHRFSLKYPDSWWSAPFLLWGKQDGFRGLLQRTAPIVLIAAVNNFALRHFPKWITDAATAVHW